MSDTDGGSSSMVRCAGTPRLGLQRLSFVSRVPIGAVGAVEVTTTTDGRSIVCEGEVMGHGPLQYQYTRGAGILRHGSFYGHHAIRYFS
jgi:hypothetical protein